MTSSTPAVRISPVNGASVEPRGEYVLYWMTAARRVRFNFALQRAVTWALKLAKPLVVLEALRCDYPWASDRLHQFVIDGMADTAARCANIGVTYYPYVEPQRGAGKGLLRAISTRACVVVTDEFPCFFLPRMIRAAGRQLDVLLEQVDGNGLLPLRATERDYPTAYAFRRVLQKQVAEHLRAFPAAEPLRALGQMPLASLPDSVQARWPAAPSSLLQARGDATALAALPIDHSVVPVPWRGGAATAIAQLHDFELRKYAEQRNQPEQDATSGLSPYLHFGQISVHEVMDAIFERESWSIDRLGWQADGKRHGFWGLSAAAESFVDELITWRELGYHFCFHRPDYARYDSLPEWARRTLAEHANDPRVPCYAPDQFERAETHDPLWNAAQRQLLREGRIHNYLRMLWGKKILEWAESPQRALEVMLELNNKYALDGRDPNSYSGIFWVLGRFDRAWGPERPVFGKIRYMSSANTARKVSVKGYIKRYG